MKIYMVGGAVRDTLLGLPVADHDWVVVGAQPDALVALGFVPVGRDFPVFLHPQTHEEYALARTERNTARGYRGFEVHAAPDVTLEQDLARRDLTINSIAAPARQASENGIFYPDLDALVDPYGGQGDIRAKVLRHVTGAFREDPVRILRLARFAARFADFSVAPETMALMQDMVRDGEADALVPERIWQELARGLMEAKPSRMLDVLKSCGALQTLLPEIDRLWGTPQRAGHPREADAGSHLRRVLDRAAQLGAPLPVRFACLCHDLGQETAPAGELPPPAGHQERSARLLQGICQRLRVPADCREIAEVVAREHDPIHRSSDSSPAVLVRLLERCDAFRKPRRFADILLACECTAGDQPGVEPAPYLQRPRLLQALSVSQGVVTEALAKEALAAGCSGPAIGEWIYRARVAAVGQSAVAATAPAPAAP